MSEREPNATVAPQAAEAPAGGLGTEPPSRSENAAALALQQLEVWTRLRREIPELQAVYMEAARAEGATWRDVGLAIGVTPQGAQQFYDNHAARPLAQRRPRLTPPAHRE